MAIRVATQEDIPALMALEGRHYVGNLEESEQGDGFISILHSQRWFTRAVADGGVHVSTADDGGVIGFIVVTTPPDASETTSPIMRAMLELAATLRFNGRLIAQQRFAFRGPVLIDEAARGQGIYSAFNAVMRQAYADRFDVGVIFVADDNPRSLHTATTKLGALQLATFEVDSRYYHFLAFPF